MDGIGYTGHVMDAGTGLVYMQQRYYDPVIPRFLSVDPVTADSVSGGNFNRYWYANDNPYRFYDPDGRCTGSHITGAGGMCASTGETTTESRTARSPQVPRYDPNAQAPQSKPGNWFQENIASRNWLTGDGSITDFGALAHDVIYPLMDSPEGAGFKLAGGGLMAVRLGTMGEDAVRAVYDIGGKGSFFINGRARIADGLNRGANVISEIKNTQSLSYTRQLRDYVDFSKSKGFDFHLYVRPGTKLSAPLREAEANKDIVIRSIP